jgi:hypothetical protein
MTLFASKHLEEHFEKSLNKAIDGIIFPGDPTFCSNSYAYHLKIRKL